MSGERYNLRTRDECLKVADKTRACGGIHFRASAISTAASVASLSTFKGVEFSTTRDMLMRCTPLDLAPVGDLPKLRGLRDVRSREGCEGNGRNLTHMPDL